MDTCWACKKEDIDVNVELFKKVAPSGDGRVHGIMWSGPKVGGGKLPGGSAMVVQDDGAWEGQDVGVEDDGRWVLEGADEDVEMSGEEGGKSRVELQMEVAEEEIVREKGCMGKVSRVMRHLRVWA